MSGSYEHLLPSKEGEGGWSMIENMGDAYECVEELFWLVERYIGRERTIHHLKDLNAEKRGERPVDESFEFVQRQMSR